MTGTEFSNGGQSNQETILNKLIEIMAYNLAR